MAGEASPEGKSVKVKFLSKTHVDMGGVVVEEAAAEEISVADLMEEDGSTRLNSNPTEGGKPFSTFQSLSTHIWHAVTRARQLKLEEITVYTVCRKRIDPPMPESYFGNPIPLKT